MTEYTIDGEAAIAAITGGSEWHAYDKDSSLRTKKVTAAQLKAYLLQSNFINLIDGGDFTTNPWQRGTSQAADIANTVTYMADRFFTVGGASSAINWSKQADTGIAGFSQALRWQRKSANTDTAVINMGQVMETADSIRCQGQSVTLSFYVKCGANFLASSATFTVKVISGTSTDDTAANMVAGSWSGQANVINTTVAPTTSDVLVTLTGSVGATATQLGLLISYTPSGTAGANEWLQFKGFQLEIGNTFSVFEHRDVEVELSLCQRYYFQLNEVNGAFYAVGGVTGSNTQVYTIGCPTTMRAAPTVTVTTGGFSVVIDGAGATAVVSFAAGTHTTQIINLTAGNTVSAAAHNLVLKGTNTTGKITASADY
jgi:hypothetical protein